MAVPLCWRNGVSEPETACAQTRLSASILGRQFQQRSDGDGQMGTSTAKAVDR